MKSLGIRAKIYILILIVLIPLIVLQCMSIASRYKSSIDTEFRASEDFAQAVSYAFMNYLDDLWDTELALGRAIASGHFHAPEDMEKFMGEISQRQPTVLRYSWVSPDGKVIASSEDHSEGIYLADREYFQRIIAGEEKVVTDIVRARLSEDVIMPVARGIRQDGKLLGVVVAAVDINSIGLVLPDYRIGNTSAFGLADSRGRIVYRSGYTFRTLEERLVHEDSPVWQALRGETVKTYRQSSRFSEDKHMGVHLPISQIGWECFATISVDEVLLRYWYDINISLIFLLGVSVISFIMGTSAIVHFLKPIDALQRASQAIINGDLTVRTNVGKGDELADAAMAFDRMAERIEQLEINRKFFLQTSAHELRNPMTGIKGIIALMRRRMARNEHDTNTVQMLEVMENEIDRLSGLLNRILEAFRVQEGAMVLKENYKPLDLVQMIKYVLKPFSAVGNDHIFIFEGEGQEPIWVLGDDEHLEGVVRNLLENAIKYSPGGSIIRVELGVSRDYAAIRVKDQGIGVPEDQLTRIFESFFRSDNLTGNDPGGMGLGLYICREVVERHGGSIWAENNKDEGSTFNVRLPVYENRRGM